MDATQWKARAAIVGELADELEMDLAKSIEFAQAITPTEHKQLAGAAKEFFRAASKARKAYNAYEKACELQTLLRGIARQQEPPQETSSRYELDLTKLPMLTLDD